MSRVRVNYKSDLPPIGVTFMLGDQEVPVPATDFVVRFFVEGSPGPSFECAHKGEEYINCEVTSEDTLTCYINNHELGCGRLCCEFIDLSRNVKYADGVQKTVTPTKLDIVLVDGAGDDLVDISASVAIDIETIIGEIREAMERLDEYADIIAALQAAVATIPDVIDDLETGGHTDALSAEQGKVLKEIIDNLGRISIEGIKGFWPIDSLDDLPESPTEEQKKLAYLYENALYIYVGAGGDTLDGKYKSTQLVTLDWNDKAYAPSIYNGLGRTTLKKNMVEGVNVLTSAMIGTANTEYFIQYDYDLDGATVTLPANASLVFMGGSIKNGTLVGNNTRIQAKKGVCIFDGITIQGTWDVAEAYSSWFKMHKKGYKIKSVTENGTTIDGVNYATFRVEGYNADSTIDYVAAPSSVAGTFNASGYAQYDDTSSIQSLLDLRANKTIIEEGIYIIKGDKNYTNEWYNGLFFDDHKDCELVVEGWLKVFPNDKYNFFAFDIVGCQNVIVSGNGGIQGDLLEHLNNTGEGGMNIAIANTKNLTIEGITTSYAWGDCIYNHYNTRSKREGTPEGNALQGTHAYKNVNIVCGGRTGLVYERGDNVVVDGCYFSMSGRVRRRGVGTWSAVDVEPDNGSSTPKRFCKNFEFKNNVFDVSANGLRLERCANCNVHDNEFRYASGAAIYVVWHKDVAQNITSFMDSSWEKSYMKIYNNIIKRASQGIALSSSDLDDRVCKNVEVYGNTIISSDLPINATYKLESCHIFSNTTYGCGQWRFAPLVNCDIWGNKNFGCKMPPLTPEVAETGGNARIIAFSSFSDCKGSNFHHNHFSLDYGKPIFGLGDYGKEELYHGLPVGYGYSAVYGCTLTEPSKVSFYENYISDDFYVYYGDNYGDGGRNGINSTRSEASEMFVKGDTFRSDIYGDEGIVVSGGIISCSWLEDASDFSAGMDVSYGELVRIGTKYKMCCQAGTCGDSLVEDQIDCGSAKFIKYAVAKDPDSSSAANLDILFKTRGICTSSTRPSTFLFKGRKMYETNTGKFIVYDGSEWAEEEI